MVGDMRTHTCFSCLTAALVLGASLLWPSLSLQDAYAAAPAEAKRERLAADAPRTTVLGNTFVAPAGWTISTRGRSTVLEAPEGGSFLVLFDAPVKEIATADDAVKAAWAEYRPDAKWPLKVTTPIADRDGWTYRVEGVPGEAVRVVARAPEAGSVTCWLIV